MRGVLGNFVRKSSFDRAVAVTAIVLGTVICGSAALAEDESNAHAIANKFSNASPSQGNSGSSGHVIGFDGAGTKTVEGAERDEVLRKIEAIKKKAAAAWKSKRSKTPEVEPTKVKTIEINKDDDGVAEAQAKLKAEARRQARAAKAAEERRKAEQERLAREAQRRATQRKAEAEARRREEEARKRAEAEARKIKQEAEARRAEERRQAERAHREAERQRQADAQRRANAARQERERARQLEARRLVDPAEQRRIDEENRLADELELRAQQRDTIDARRRAAERRALEAQRSQDWVRIAEEEERRRHKSRPNTGWSGAPAPVNARAARREAEALQLSERLRRARQSRQPAGNPSMDGRSADPLGKFGNRGEWSSPILKRPLTTRATVLLIMDVGNSGIRTWSKTADPMLCLNDKCYLSSGRAKAAKALSRGQAFGPSVALFSRGMACRSKPTCIFRDIDFGSYDALMQPVDLRILRHDRREKRMVRIDPSCRMDQGRLSCSNLVQGTGWRAWIVPENIAVEAGPAMLKRALNSGLRSARSASAY